MAIPRFSYYYNNGLNEKYNELLDRISQTLTILALPASVGVFMLSKEIILLLSGQQYLEATNSLRILSVAVVFVAASWILSQCILIPMKLEKYVLYTTVGTAALNILLNLILVQGWKHNATAITTLIAEATVTFIYWVKIKKNVEVKGIFKCMRDSIIGSLFIVLSIVIIKIKISNYIICLISSIAISVLVYFSVLIMLKNKTALFYFGFIKEKIKGCFITNN